MPLCFRHNFGQYLTLFKILSLLDSSINLPQYLCFISRCTLNMSLHYLVKGKCWNFIVPKNLAQQIVMRDSPLKKILGEWRRLYLVYWRKFTVVMPKIPRMIVSMCRMLHWNVCYGHIRLPARWCPWACPTWWNGPNIRRAWDEDQLCILLDERSWYWWTEAV